MGRALRAGLAYFALVFAAGFALGTLRTLVLVPSIGESRAVLLELPVMLMICWLTCGALLRSLEVPARSVDRLAMGGSAFALLMMAELGVARFAFGRSLAEHLAHYATVPGALGLVGQFGFAAFPLIALRLRR